MTPLQLAQKAKAASLAIASFSSQQKNKALKAMAEALTKNASLIYRANAEDLKQAQLLADQGKLSPAVMGRLAFNDAKLRDLCLGIEALIAMPDPIGEVLGVTELDENLILKKVRCPLGVIGIIFESRPDVIPQITALAVKSSNAVLLKGGAEALHTNKALIGIIKDALESASYPPDAVALLESREEAAALLSMDNLVDLIIPRGGNALVRFVQDNTKIPVLGHADGVCHIYIETSVSADMACAVCIDAKVGYPTACNAVECLLIQEGWSHTPMLLRALQGEGVTIRGDASIQKMGQNIHPAEDSDWGKEYSDKIIAVKMVSGIDEAISHINTFGSHHTDAILTGDKAHAEAFLNQVDSAGVYHNASTRFADGFRYGFGAEVGISTAKTHSRGPVGIDGLTIYKYKIYGNGHIVSSYTGDNPRAFTHKKIL